MSVKHVAAAVASLRKLRGSTLFLNSACCCRCLLLRETASHFRLRVRAADENVPPTSASINYTAQLDKCLRCKHFWYKLASLSSRLVKSCLPRKFNPRNFFVIGYNELWVRENFAPREKYSLYDIKKHDFTILSQNYSYLATLTESHLWGWWSLFCIRHHLFQLYFYVACH